jgi:hypothetical protein
MQTWCQCCEFSTDGRERLRFPGLPIVNRFHIDFQTLGEFVFVEPEQPPQRADGLGKSGWDWRWVIAKETHYRWPFPDVRNVVVCLPTDVGCGGDSEDSCRLFLGLVEVQTALPKVLPKGHGFPRISSDSLLVRTKQTPNLLNMNREKGNVAMPLRLLRRHQARVPPRSNSHKKIPRAHQWPLAGSRRFQTALKPVPNDKL